MNRIREIRESLGWSKAELARRLQTSVTQVMRLEDGQRRLAQDWMNRIAEAFQCAPADLIAGVEHVPEKPDIEPAESEVLSAISSSLLGLGVRIYRVTGTSVVRSGVGPGAIITVDERPDVVRNAKSGAVVVVEFDDGPRVLRQLIEPNLLVTNRPGNNVAVTTDDRSVRLRIVGLVLPRGP